MSPLGMLWCILECHVCFRHVMVHCRVLCNLLVYCSMFWNILCPLQMSGFIVESSLASEHNACILECSVHSRHVTVHAGV